MFRTLRTLIGVGLMVSAGSAFGQVAYEPYAPSAPTPYGYPVPSGFLQPNETLGTSPSYVVSSTGYGGPVLGVVQRCQYPNGWNVTDFDRDVNGIPAGDGHTCPVPVRVGRPLRARF